MLWLSCGDLSWRELSSIDKYLTADSRKVTSKAEQLKRNCPE